MAKKTKKEIVAENLDNIKGWIEQGIFMQDIAKKLGMSKATLYKYLNAIDSDFIAKNRAPLVAQLENTMFQKATGFERVVKKAEKVKQCIYENGKKAMEWEEIVEYEETVYYPPDTTAGIFLMKNWGNYMNEPRAMEIRKREVELKEKQQELNDW